MRLAVEKIKLYSFMFNNVYRYILKQKTLNKIFLDIINFEMCTYTSEKEEIVKKSLIYEQFLLRTSADKKETAGVFMNDSNAAYLRS